MDRSASEAPEVAKLIRKRADQCREIARRAPRYTLNCEPNETWLRIADALASIAVEIETIGKAPGEGKGTTPARV